MNQSFVPAARRPSAVRGVIAQHRIEVVPAGCKRVRIDRELSQEVLARSLELVMALRDDL
jgi:hypothetical protein